MDTGTEGLPTTDPAPSGVDTGAAPEASSAAEFQQEPAAPASDAPTYVVKIDGQEHQVTLEDLQSGYMRQADYTRKTQELAARRQQLTQAEAIAVALERNPQETLRALQEAYGIPTQTADPNVVEEPLDPFEQKVMELDRLMQQQQLAQQQEQIDRELTSLKTEHGDFDEMELFTFAVQNNISNLNNAFWAWRGPQAVAARAAAEAKAAEEAARLAEQKRSLAGIEGGAHRSGIAAGTGKPSSFRDAFLAAKQELGLS